MSEALAAVPTEPDLKEMLRALQYAAWRIETVFIAISNDKSESEDATLSMAGQIMLESGMEAVGVSMDLAHKIPAAIGVDVSCGKDGPSVSKHAYIRSILAGRAESAPIAAVIAEKQEGQS